MGPDKKELTLADTIPMMVSADYKERFKAEYFQLKIRYDKLMNMCDKLDAKELDFTPTCPRDMYVDQLNAMGSYIKVLQQRAELENVDLSMEEVE